MEKLKNRYRLFRRTDGTFYWQDNTSRRQGSLRTKDRVEAGKLLHAKNDAGRVPVINLKMAQAYLTVHNPKMLTRTWTDVMEQMCRRGKPSTQVRCRRVFRSDHFDLIRDNVLVQTTADDLLATINTSDNSIVHYLRRLHNFASKRRLRSASSIPDSTTLPRALRRGRRLAAPCGWRHRGVSRGGRQTDLGRVVDRGLRSFVLRFPTVPHGIAVGLRLLRLARRLFGHG